MKPSNTTSQGAIATRWGPEYRFTVKPLATLPFRATQDTALEQLKDRLLLASLADNTPAALNVLLRRAANEAASLAWASAYPLLVFPGLFEEKSAQARRQFSRQENIRRRSLRVLAQAA